MDCCPFGWQWTSKFHPHGDAIYTKTDSHADANAEGAIDKQLPSILPDRLYSTATP